MAKEIAGLAVTMASHTPRLVAYPGVHYVDIGYKYVGGAFTDQLALRMHVRQKEARGRLPNGQLLPATISGLPTDVIQSNRRLETGSNIMQRDLRFNPLVGGIAIRNPRHKVLGTLGAIVRELTTETYMGLSNYHVLVGESGRTGAYTGPEDPWEGQPADSGCDGGSEPPHRKINEHSRRGGNRYRSR